MVSLRNLESPKTSVGAAMPRGVEAVRGVLGLLERVYKALGECGSCGTPVYGASVVDRLTGAFQVLLRCGGKELLVARVDRLGSRLASHLHFNMYMTGARYVSYGSLDTLLLVEDALVERRVWVSVAHVDLDLCGYPVPLSENTEQSIYSFRRHELENALASLVPYEYVGGVVAVRRVPPAWRGRVDRDLPFVAGEEDYEFTAVAGCRSWSGLWELARLFCPKGSSKCYFEASIPLRELLTRSADACARAALDVLRFVARLLGSSAAAAETPRP